MVEVAATRQPEAVLPLRIGRQQAQVKPRARAAVQTLSPTNAEVAHKYNNAAAVAACAKIGVIAVAIAVMMLLPRLGLVAAIQNKVPLPYLQNPKDRFPWLHWKAVEAVA